MVVQELEGLNPTADPINSPAFSGRWALLYTAPIDGKSSQTTHYLIDVGNSDYSFVSHLDASTWRHV